MGQRTFCRASILHIKPVEASTVSSSIVKLLEDCPELAQDIAENLRSTSTALLRAALASKYAMGSKKIKKQRQHPKRRRMGASG